MPALGLTSAAHRPRRRRPQRSTSPSVAGRSVQLFFTTYGSSTSVGPRNSEIGDRRRDERSPEPDAPSDEAEPFLRAPSAASSRSGRRRRRRAAPATREQRDRERRRVDGECRRRRRAATSAPPSAGPASRSAIGRTNWSSELAAARSARGTSSGTIASKAGVKNAVRRRTRRRARRAPRTAARPSREQPPARPRRPRARRPRPASRAAGRGGR